MEDSSMEDSSMEDSSMEGNSMEDSSMEDNHTDPALALLTLELWFNRRSKRKHALHPTPDTITHSSLRYPTLFLLHLPRLCHQRLGGTVSNLFNYHLS
jgi:hypothetical protein